MRLDFHRASKGAFVSGASPRNQTIHGLPIGRPFLSRGDFDEWKIP